MSLPPPFWEELTTSVPASSATRVSPPGISATSSPQNANGRRSTWRGLQLAVDHRRVARQRDDRLGDEVLGVLAQLAGEALEVGAVGVGADDDAVAALPVAGLDDELAQPRRRSSHSLRRGERQRRHGAHLRLLVEVEAHEVLDMAVRELVVGEPVAEAR